MRTKNLISPSIMKELLHAFINILEINQSTNQSFSFEAVTTVPKYAINDA